VGVSAPSFSGKGGKMTKKTWGIIVVTIQAALEAVKDIIFGKGKL